MVTLKRLLILFLKWIALKLALAVLTGRTVCSEFTQADALRKTILGHYNKSIPPPSQDLSPIDVSMHLTLFRIAQLDEHTGTLISEGIVTTIWKDSRLSWVADKEAAKMNYLKVMPEDIWKPKTNLFGRYRDYRTGKRSSANSPLFIYKEGMIYWPRFNSFQASCRAENLRWYPMDTHVCVFSAWAMFPQDYFQIMFRPSMEQQGSLYIGGLFKKGAVWDLLDAKYQKVEFNIVNDLFYPADEFTLKIVRRSPLVALWSLSVLLSCLALCWASFGIPPSGGALLNRMSLGVAATVLCSVLLLALVKSLPGTEIKTPILVVMCTTCTILTCLSTIHTVVVSVLLRKPPRDFGYFRKLPTALQTFLGISYPNQSSEHVDVSGLLPRKDSESIVEQFQKEPDPPEPLTWHHVTEALDRVHLISQVLVLVLVFTVAVLV